MSKRLPPLPSTPKYLQWRGKRHQNLGKALFHLWINLDFSPAFFICPGISMAGSHVPMLNSFSFWKEVVVLSLQGTRGEIKCSQWCCFVDSCFESQAFCFSRSVLHLVYMCLFSAPHLRGPLPSYRDSSKWSAKVLWCPGSVPFE